MGVPNGHEISRILKEKYAPRQYTHSSDPHPKNSKLIKRQPTQPWTYAIPASASIATP